MPTGDQLEQMANAARAEGRKRVAQGDTAWAARTMLAAAQGYMQVALVSFPSLEGAREFFANRGMPSLLKEAIDLNRSLFEDFKHSGGPGSQVITDPTFSNFCWLFEEFETGWEHLEICSDEALLQSNPQTRFWREYTRAMTCLSARVSYSLPDMKLKGYEKRWALYLDLVAALLTDTGVTEARAEVRSSFIQRNRDKRLIDWQLLDGDGRHPVRWDFRYESIMICNDAGLGV